MNSSLPLASVLRQMRRATILILVFWTLAIAASVVWNVRLLHNAMFEAATHDARNSFNKDVLYRRWATSHGGVYVPVTDLKPPNPHLTDVFERDIVTPSGRQLTLMNPAYMTRQVHELGLEYGSRGHITSLNPLRPENAPDDWETAALQAFEKGQTEVISREMQDGQLQMRFMKPLIAEVGCLKCHAVQGYKEGDIRGGVSVSVALTPYFVVAHARKWPIAGIHAGLWILGVLGLLLGVRQMREGINKQLQVEEKIKSLLKEKEMLIREVHHRVKNNFAVVSSLLGLQSRAIHDKEVKAMFLQSRDRIKSMSLIHERLYQSQDLTHINLSEYIKTLATDLFQAYEINPDRISTVIEVDDIVLHVDKVLPCGLIVNELISNALKYAFPENRTGKGQVKVSLHTINKNEIELAVTDNGVGLSDDFNIEKSPSLGLQLVTMLAESQLRGKLKVNGKGGAEFKIQFALNPPEVRSGFTS